MSASIVAKKISKRYSRNANQHRGYGLSDLFRELLGRMPQSELRRDEFYAVHEASFEIHPGDSFALIGRNGSGKTTILKMLTGLVKPDTGEVTLEGRVQALINLGAGFNPELSGRENVHNSAALMGLNAAGTNEIIDEVILFAELEEFIDSPIETYSSGMKARLGFSVAVHLKPDILLVDEILSVGDYGFQNKCFHKLQELKRSGVTLVLVSHSPTSVVQLCERALWIHDGRTMKIGKASEVVKEYIDFLEEHVIQGVERANDMLEDRTRLEQAESAVEEASAAVPVQENPSQEEGLYHATYGGFDHISDLKVDFRIHGRSTDVIALHDEVLIEYEFRLRHRVDDLNVSLVFYRKDGLQLGTISTLNGDKLKSVHDGTVFCTVRIPDFNLSPGEYVLVMPIHEGKGYLYRDVVKYFVVKSSGKLAWALLDFTHEIQVRSGETSGS
jgi:ABC-type polysaccharide/polyol phosphate transport system ATPase subunit